MRAASTKGWGLLLWGACLLFGFLQPASAQYCDDLPVLIAGLRSPFSSDVTKAAREITLLGREAWAAVPALTEALEKARFSDEREAVIRALGSIGPAARPAVPALSRQLKKAPFSSDRLAIIDTLGRMGRWARPALPDLSTHARSGPFMDEREAARIAIARIEIDRPYR